jgi:CelD/BcsL family acetyltransferase involved in cellulose biosynthesis
MHQGDDIATILDPQEEVIACGPLTVEVVRENTTFLSLRKEWNTLAELSRSTVYQTHEWASLWWKHYGTKSCRLFVLVLRSENAAVGIAPFFVEEKTVGNIVMHRRIALMGSGTAFQNSFGVFFDDGPSDYLDIMAAPGYESLVMRTMADYLCRSTDRIDDLVLVNIPQESAIRSILIPAMEVDGFVCRQSRGDVCPYLPVPVSVNEYLQNISSSVRRRLNQAQKTVDDGSLYTLSKMKSLEEFSSALNDIIALHQQRWNRIGYPGLFADERFRSFQQELLTAFHRNGWLWCTTANADGKCVAARLAFTFNNTMYDYLSGFDDTAASAKRRPGLAIILSMMQNAIDEQRQTIDFLRGEEQYKFELTSEVRYNWNIIVSPTSQRGIHSIMHKLFTAVAFARFIASREVRLFLVQYHQHHFPTCVVQYVKFRSPRLTRKIAGLIGNTPATTQTPQEDA